jgi:hypothetical protein
MKPLATLPALPQICALSDRNLRPAVHPSHRHRSTSSSQDTCCADRLNSPPEAVIKLNCSRRESGSEAKRATTSAANLARCEFMLQSNGCVAVQRGDLCDGCRAATDLLRLGSLLHDFLRTDTGFDLEWFDYARDPQSTWRSRLPSADLDAASEAARHFPMSRAFVVWPPHLLCSDHDAKPVSRNSAFLEKLAILSDAGD